MKNLLLVAFVLVSFSAQAEVNKRGLITSTNCPYTCADAGLTSEFCKEKRIGNTCQIEDLTQPPGHRTMVRVHTFTPSEGVHISPKKTEQRGLVTTSNCPYDCELARVPSQYCRQWKEGGKCKVEDLRQPAGHRSRVGMP